MLHWRYLLHDTNSDRHTRVLNVLGQLAPDWGIKETALTARTSSVSLQ